MTRVWHRNWITPSRPPDAYEKHGVDELASRRIADFLRIRYGGTTDAKRLLGPVPAIRDAFIAIQAHLYRYGDRAADD